MLPAPVCRTAAVINSQIRQSCFTAFCLSAASLSAARFLIAFPLATLISLGASIINSTERSLTLVTVILTSFPTIRYSSLLTDNLSICKISLYCVTALSFPRLRPAFACNILFNLLLLLLTLNISVTVFKTLYLFLKFCNFIKYENIPEIAQEKLKRN